MGLKIGYRGEGGLEGTEGPKRRGFWMGVCTTVALLNSTSKHKNDIFTVWSCLNVTTGRFSHQNGVKIGNYGHKNSRIYTKFH